VEDLEEFPTSEPEKAIRVGSQLDLTQKEKLVSFLHKNSDAFTWSHEDMAGILQMLRWSRNQMGSGECALIS
jgi:hypothetical protein